MHTKAPVTKERVHIILEHQRGKRDRGRHEPGTQSRAFDHSHTKQPQGHRHNICYHGSPVDCSHNAEGWPGQRKRKRGVITGPISRYGTRQMHTHHFTPIIVPLTNPHLKGQNTTMRAAILRPAVCISDVINKAKICGKSINYVTNVTWTWLRREELQLEAKGLLPYNYGQNKQMKLQADGNICNCSTFWGQLASSVGFSMPVLQFSVPASTVPETAITPHCCLGLHKPSKAVAVTLRKWNRGTGWGLACSASMLQSLKQSAHRHYLWLKYRSARWAVNKVCVRACVCVCSTNPLSKTTTRRHW